MNRLSSDDVNLLLQSEFVWSFRVYLSNNRQVSSIFKCRVRTEEELRRLRKYRSVLSYHCFSYFDSEMPLVLVAGCINFR